MTRTHVSLMDEAGVHDMAGHLARVLKPGDTVLLSGPIGAGKSVLARALVRAWLNDPGADVPSPSYTLVQTYDRDDAALWHVDLYRLDPGGGEATELGLDEAFATAICLVEWPERLDGDLPVRRLTIDLVPVADDPNLRNVTIATTGAWDWTPDNIITHEVSR